MTAKFLRNDSGTGVAELALVAPFLIFLLLGLIDFGRYMYFGILAADAARAGVQYGAQNTHTAQDIYGMKDAATADGESLSQWTASPQTLCSTDGATLKTCPTDTIPGAGTVYYVKVQVSGTFTTLVQYPGLSGSVPVSGSAIMRVISQ
jgi:Flp pilus assembly protein TadG